MAHEAYGRPYTVEDLEGMPDDGRRYELIDGVLIVSPAPVPKHQKIVGKLFVSLDQVCPDDLHVFTAPPAVRPSPSVELRPDLLVARDEDLTEECLPVAPLLAVEVLSPSTAWNDLNGKKFAHERLGVRSYWVIDPQELELTAFELDADGRYELVAEVKGDDAFEATLPFPVRIVPGGLPGTLRK